MDTDLSVQCTGQMILVAIAERDSNPSLVLRFNSLDSSV